MLYLFRFTRYYSGFIWRFFTEQCKVFDGEDKHKDTGTGGGGGSGGNLPPTWKLWERRPQIWTVDVAHFYFCLFLYVNLGTSQNIMGKIRGVLDLGRGYLEPLETFPPPNFKVVPASLDKQDRS